ncbi:MAG TPA: serine/threonine-protein kinase [Phycisphaerae bacterium]|nr:serine/threonine-protein kinase [Phycisphaerae bacterium]
MTLSPANKQDTIVGRLVVEQGFATKEEVQDCLAMQSELSKEQNQRSLADLLVSNGFATKGQMERLRSVAEEQGAYQQIPGYQILSKLGAGAMATVFKARQVSLNRIVAIKVLPKRMSDNKEFVERFYKEGQAAARLNHPNIVAAYDVGEANGFHYFVMEYVEGASVYEKLEKGERYSEKEALKLVIETCRALQHAHKAGFVHRDVKPKNIMITKEGTAKLADMGLARETADVQAAQAEAGKAYGTPYYISPEQIKGEMNIDGRADLYSLGATLYHMVTGRVPFDAPTPSAVMLKHLKEELVPPDHLVKDLSTGIGEVIEVAMAKNRDKRYQSAEDMLGDLEQVAKGEPPLVARRSYNLSSLNTIESTGAELPEGELPVSAANTVDIGGRTMTERLTDPIVLALGAALMLAIIVILALLMK